MKRGRYWTFALVDPTGGSLLRMSTQNKSDGEVWVAFFVQAGCTVAVPPPPSRPFEWAPAWGVGECWKRASQGYRAREF
jgi:hypothetical protein